jgi:hypothetical protein
MPQLAPAGQLSFAWDPNRETNLLDYVLSYRLKGTTYTNRVVIPADVTNVTVKGLIPKGLYVFTLTARNIDGLESRPSNAVADSDRPPLLSEIADQVMVADTTLTGVPFTLAERETPEAVSVTAKGNPPWLVPDESIVISGTGANRTLTVTPAPGKDGHGTITLLVSDGGQETRTHFKLTVQPAESQQSLLRIQTHGPGAVTPKLDGQALNVGERYRLTAQPAPNSIFMGWSGSITSSSPVISVVMEPNLALEARFMADPYPPLAGTYSGLFGGELLAPRSAGAFTLKVTSRGAYSGKFLSGRSAMSVAGQLDVAGHAAHSALKFGTNLVTLALQFELSGDTVTGQLDTDVWGARLEGARAVYSATNPAPFAGRFTEVLPGSLDAEGGPEGHGFGIIKISGAGLATFTGSLADGTKISQATALVRAGDWPLYIALYGGAGMLWGWQNVAQSSSVSGANGLLRWSRLPQPAAKFWPEGFTEAIVPLTSAYLPPAPSTRVVNLEEAQLSFRGGAFAEEFTQMLTIDLRNKVHPSGALLSMSFVPATGLFSGKLNGVENGAARKFQGVLLQPQQTGAGFLLTSNASAQVQFGWPATASP